MQQIKLLQTNGRTDEGRFSFEETQFLSKPRNGEQMERIEPWEEEAGSNPYLNLRAKDTKLKDSVRIKRKASLPFGKNWKSVEKIASNRQSKILPVMDIGKLNSIKRAGFSTSKLRSLGNTQSNVLYRVQTRPGISSEMILPSVKRELLIERKIFLLKLSSEGGSPFSSPAKSSRVRTIIYEART